MAGYPIRVHTLPGEAGKHTEPPYLRIHAVNIFVRDQERSLRFFVEQLGFELAFDARLQTGQRWLAVSPPDGTAVLTLVAPEPDSEAYKLIGRPTQVVFVTEDVAAKYAEWRKRGVRFRYAPRLRRVKYERREAQGTLSGLADAPGGAGVPIWGGVFTRFDDIDGNTFELVSFDEVSRAVEAQRRAVALKLESERRAAQELEIARQVQSRLFPQTLPPCNTLEYSGVCLQAHEVGGDYYDFLSLGQERLGMVIADISGKGIAAALLMANLQANLRSQCAMALEDPQRFLQSVNHLFCENSVDSAYATLLFAEYDDRSRRLRYVNCGHLSGLLLRSDNRLERLASTCTVLGLFNDWQCEIGERQLSPGDTLALYTDGITESLNGRDEEYGELRLAESLRRHRGLSCESLLAAMVDDVQKFTEHRQRDDITLIVAHCGGA